MKRTKSRNKNRFSLSQKDRKRVHKLLKSEKAARVFSRLMVLKMSDEGYGPSEIQNLKFTTDRTVRNILSRYEAEGLEFALRDRQRHGQPRKLSRNQEEKIAAIACTNPPEGQARWTLNLIKERAEKDFLKDGISTETLRIILASREIKPWKYKMWCVPKINDEFIKCMEDVLAIYERPYNSKEPVICIDEKPLQLLSSSRPDISGKIMKQDYEYKRNGVVNAFCGIEPKAGKHFLLIRERKTMKDFAFFVREIVKAYPTAKKIHLVMDNLGTHKETALIKTFGSREGKRIWGKIEPHYTPKHASWLNQAEIEISMFSRGCIGKQRVASLHELKKRGSAWKKRMNRKKVKIDWTFSRRKARVKFKYKIGKN